MYYVKHIFKFTNLPSSYIVSVVYIDQSKGVLYDGLLSWYSGRYRRNKFGLTLLGVQCGVDGQWRPHRGFDNCVLKLYFWVCCC